MQAPAHSDPLRLVNRFTPADDGWILLSPLGTFPHVDDDGVPLAQAVTPEAVRAMVENYRAAGKPELLLDFEHHSTRPDGSTEAAGWIDDLSARNNGLWAHVRWTEEGEAAIRGGRYRYISPVWSGPMQENAESERVVTPTYLFDAGLTNRPNLPVPALSNRNHHPHKEQHIMPDQLRQRLANRLNLKEDASDEAIINALPTEELATLKEQVETLTKERDALRNSVIDADLARFADVIDDPESAKALLLANRDLAVKTFESIQKRFAPEGEKPEKEDAAPGPMTNRQPPKPPAQPPATQGTRTEDRADQAEAAVREYQLANKCSYEQAHSIVRMRKPELFDAQAS